MHFRVLSRILSKTPEPANTTVAEENPPVEDLGLDSDTSSAVSVEFCPWLLRSPKSLLRFIRRRASRPLGGR